MPLQRDNRQQFLTFEVLVSSFVKMFNSLKFFTVSFTTLNLSLSLALLLFSQKGDERPRQHIFKNEVNNSNHVLHKLVALGKEDLVLLKRI